jgi:hypothetical protein
MKKYTDVFVKYDINGNPLFIGDAVRVTRERINFTEELDNGLRKVDIPAMTWEGEIALLFSKGIRIRLKKGTHTSYIKPNLRNSGYVKWTWEKL